MGWRGVTGARLWLLVGGLVLAGCASGLPMGGADIERTWTQALVVLPATASGEAPLMARRSSRALERAARRLPPGTRFPTVVFLHGCTGIGKHHKVINRQRHRVINVEDARLHICTFRQRRDRVGK